MDGITTGSTLFDALLLALIPVLTVLAQRFGFGWLFDKAKPKPDEKPYAIPAQPGEGAPFAAPLQNVAFDWMALISLLIPVIMEMIKAFRERNGREPTPKEVREMVKKVRFYADTELKDDELEQVGGGKNRLKSTLDNFDRTVTDIGRAARRGDEAFKNFNGMFRQT